MGILKSWFKSVPPPEPTWEIVEKRLSLDDQRYQVRIKKGGKEFYAEDFFKKALKTGNLEFSRFLLLDEKPPKPYFAPSLQEAVDWFTGRKKPKDGYLSIWWGDRFPYVCAICQAQRVVTLRITRVERLAVASAIPISQEIVGWRVVEVESELTGKGIPTKKLDDYKTVPVIQWHKFPNRYLCGKCARKLAAAGRKAELADAFVFEAG